MKIFRPSKRKILLPFANAYNKAKCIFIPYMNTERIERLKFWVHMCSYSYVDCWRILYSSFLNSLSCLAAENIFSSRTRTTLKNAEQKAKSHCKCSVCTRMPGCQWAKVKDKNKKHQIIFSSWHMSVFVHHSEIRIERLIFWYFIRLFSLTLSLCFFSISCSFSAWCVNSSPEFNATADSCEWQHSMVFHFLNFLIHICDRDIERKKK